MLGVWIVYHDGSEEFVRNMTRGEALYFVKMGAGPFGGQEGLPALFKDGRRVKFTEGDDPLGKLCDTLEDAKTFLSTQQGSVRRFREFAAFT